MGETTVSPIVFFTRDPQSQPPEDQDEGDLPSGINEDDLEGDDLDTTSISSNQDLVPGSPGNDDGAM